jgi:hypothetical protein
VRVGAHSLLLLRGFFLADNRAQALL